MGFGTALPWSQAFSGVLEDLKSRSLNLGERCPEIHWGALSPKHAGAYWVLGFRVYAIIQASILRPATAAMELALDSFKGPGALRMHFSMLPVTLNPKP